MSFKAFCQQVRQPRFKLWLKFALQTRLQLKSELSNVILTLSQACRLISCHSVYFALICSDEIRDSPATVPSVWFTGWLRVCPSNGQIKPTPAVPFSRNTNNIADCHDKACTANTVILFMLNLGTLSRTRRTEQLCATCTDIEMGYNPKPFEKREKIVYRTNIGTEFSFYSTKSCLRINLFRIIVINNYNSYNFKMAFTCVVLNTWGTVEKSWLRGLFAELIKEFKCQPWLKWSEFFMPARKGDLLFFFPASFILRNTERNWQSTNF